MPGRGDANVRQLLVKLGISTRDWQRTISDIKKQLKDMNVEAARASQERLSRQQKELEVTRQQIADQKRLAAEARTMQEVDRAKAQWQKQQQEATKTATAQIQKQAAEEKKAADAAKAQAQQKILDAKLQEQAAAQINKTEAARIALQKQQVSLQSSQLRLAQQQAREAERQQKAEERKGGGGLLGKAITVGGRALFGGGSLGYLAEGIASGEIYARLLEKLAQKAHDFALSIVEAAGPAAQLREQFEKLSRGKGVPPDEYLRKLQAATHGLVDDIDLFRVANNFMQQNIGVTNDQIVKLVGTTLDLARAQGKTAPEAMQALIRASLTGRAYTLAYVTGLHTEDLMMGRLNNTYDTAAAKKAQFLKLLIAEEEQLKAIGAPMITLPELLKKWEIAQKDIIDEIGAGLQTSKAYHIALDEISIMVDKFSLNISETANKFGKAIGPVVGAGILAISQAVKGLLDISSEVMHMIQSLYDLISKKPGTGFIDDTVTRLTTIKGLMLTFYNIWQFVEITAKKTIIDLEKIGKILAAYRSPVKLGFLINQIDDWAQSQYGAVDFQAATEKREFVRALTTEGATPTGSAKGANIPSQQQAQTAREIAKLQLSIAMSAAKEKLTIYEQELQQEKAANLAAYDSGLIALTDYVDKQRGILQNEHRAKLEMLKTERDEKLKSLAIEAQGMTYKDDQGKVQHVQGMDPRVLALRRQQIQQEYSQQVVQENTRAAQEETGNTKQLLSDQLAARREFVSALNRMNLEAVKEREKDNEEEFKSGDINADQYIQTRKDLYAQQRDLADKNAVELYNTSKKNEEDLAKLRATELENEVAYENQITELTKKEGDYRLEYLDTKFGQAKKYLETQLAVEQRSGPAALPTAAGIERTIIDVTEKHIQALVAEQQKLGPLTSDNASDWLKIASEINTSQEEIQKMNVELEKTRSLAGPISDLFGAAAKNLKDIVPSRWESTLTRISEAFKQLQQYRQATAQPGGASGGLIGNIINVFRHGHDRSQQIAQTAQQLLEQAQQKSAHTIEGFSTSTQQAIKSLQDFVRAATDAADKLQHVGDIPAPEVKYTPGQAPDLSAGAGGSSPTLAPGDQSATTAHKGGFLSAIGDFITSLTGAKKATDDSTNAQEQQVSATEKFGSALHGVIGLIGAVGQTVSTIGNSQSAGSGALGGAASGFSLGTQLGGPFAAITGPIGAAIGGITGGIIGAKREAAAQDTAKIKAQLQQVIDELNSGTITLGNAINTLRQQRQAAIQILSGDKKKGQAQLPGVLSEIDSEIQKLVNQQKQTLDDMNQQILTLQQPQAFQPIIQQLDSIIKQYQQFASAAAGATSEVAAANEWLTLSLKNYTQTVANDLNQANQSAINDALKLLDLEKQRYDLIQNEARQEYDIMTQGVLQRQRGTAAQKGYEIAQLRYQRDQQLQQMDEEISVTQYKVDAEQKIFNLASTRIGLETQLLALQEAAADQQIAGIQAMQQALTEVSGAIASGNLPQAISQGGVLSSGSSLLNQILGTLGLPVTYQPPDAISAQQDYLSAIPQQFRQDAQFLNSIFPNFLHYLIEGLTGKVPQGRQVAYGQAGSAWKDLKNIDPNAQAFVNWIQSGTLPANTPIPEGVQSATGQLPPFEKGGPITQTGPILAHKGEYVLNADTVSALGHAITGSGSSAASGLRMAAENKITDMTKTRFDLEMSVVGARMHLIQQEQILLDRMQQLNGGSVGVLSLEGALQKIYELRGRYGAGTFTRQGI